MDRYFDPSYDPMLDVDTSAGELVPMGLNELIPEGPFDSWGTMLEIVKQRKEDKKREKEEGKSSKKKKKGDVEESDRERRIRLGIERPSVMDIQYAKRGAMREWDVGKEVT